MRQQRAAAIRRTRSTRAVRETRGGVGGTGDRAREGPLPKDPVLGLRGPPQPPFPAGCTAWVRGGTHQGVAADTGCPSCATPPGSVCPGDSPYKLKRLQEPQVIPHPRGPRLQPHAMHMRGRALIGDLQLASVMCIPSRR